MCTAAGAEIVILSLRERQILLLLIQSDFIPFPKRLESELGR
jgi:hypothetical protein